MLQNQHKLKMLVLPIVIFIDCSVSIWFLLASICNFILMSEIKFFWFFLSIGSFSYPSKCVSSFTTLSNDLQFLLKVMFVLTLRNSFLLVTLCVEVLRYPFLAQNKYLRDVPYRIFLEFSYNKCTQFKVQSLTSFNLFSS